MTECDFRPLYGSLFKRVGESTFHGCIMTLALYGLFHLADFSLVALKVLALPCFVINAVSFDLNMKSRAIEGELVRVLLRAKNDYIADRKVDDEK